MGHKRFGPKATSGLFGSMGAGVSVSIFLWCESRLLYAAATLLLGASGNSAVDDPVVGQSG